jgi:hypothetical protein
MKKRTKMLTAVLAVTALVAFSGVAEAGIVGGGYNLPADNSTATNTGLSMVGGDTLTIDNGSTLTKTANLALIGTYYGADGAAVLNISSGGVYEHTQIEPGDGGNAFTLGNTGGGTNQYGVVTVTGTGSLMSTLKNMRVGRTGFDTGTTIASTLTIEDGGLVMAEKIEMGGDTSGVGYVRIGYGGSLAIEGTKTLGEMTTVGNGTGELQYWTGSAWSELTQTVLDNDDDITLAAGSGALLSGYTVLTMVPEPATMSLLAIGGIALIRRRRRA